MMKALASLIKEKKKENKISESVGVGGLETSKNSRKRYLTRKEIYEAEEKKKKSKNGRNEEEEDVKKVRANHENEKTEKRKDLGKNEAKRGSISWKEMISRLRSMGEPIRLFGETQDEQLKRLFRAEDDHAHKAGLALQGAHAMKNTHLDTKTGQSGSNSNAAGENSEDKEIERKDFLDLGDTSSMSPEKHVYKFLKALLREWEFDLDMRPVEEKKTAQGKLATNNFIQCKDYLKPLFKKLRHKSIEGDTIRHLEKIAEFCEKREYTMATDWYVKLAIGNAPWPIGVTMVGIHERTGREKIESSKVAHVMNDEEQRKYLTSVKRLMTYCQKRFPAPPSKCVS